MLNDMLIFSKGYDFLKSLYPAVNRFPKSQRFTLGQRLENSALSFLEFIIAANSARDKIPLIERADLELEKLRIFIRLAHDYNFIGTKQYENASASIAELGRLLGGWKRRFSSL